MDLRRAAEIIKDTVSMEDVIGLYGNKTRGGFMRCPFHADDTASLKIYPGRRGWSCFGCHRGGSVIDFVMEHDNCDFGTAVRALDRAMELHLTEDEDPLEDWRKQDYRRCLDALEALLLDMIRDREKSIEIRLRILTQMSMRLEGNKERSAAEWAEMDNIREEMLYLEDRKSRCAGLREEVREWKRKRLRKKAP